MTPEGRVKAAIKRELDKIGAWYFMPVSSGMGKHGIPDFIICLPNGLFMAIEAKAPGKVDNVTVHQARNIAGIMKCNGIAAVVDNVEEVRRLLDIYL